LRSLARPPGTSDLRLGEEVGGGGDVDPGQSLGRRRDDHLGDVFGLSRCLDRAPQHGLERVRALRPCRGATHQVPDDRQVHLHPVQRRARPGTSHP